MSDTPRWGLAPQAPVEPQATPRWGLAPTSTNPLDAIYRLREFQEYIQTVQMAERAAVDPSVGDLALHQERAQALAERVMEMTGLTRAQFSEVAFQWQRSTDGVPPAPSGAGVRAMNALQTLGGVLEPLQLPGDALRTYTSILADIQGQRVASEGGRAPNEVNPKDSRYQGDPASNPIQAANEMWQAVVGTWDQLGFNEPGRVLDEGGQWRVNPESGWMAYLPSLHVDWFGGRQHWGVSPYEANRAVRGYEFNERFGIAERFGVTSEGGKEILGIVTEIALDPLTWADALSIFARGAAVTGRAASTVAPRVANLSNDAARQLEGLASRMYQTLSPRGAVRAVGGVLDIPTGFVSAALTGRGFGASDIVGGAINKAMNWVLDQPAWPMFLRDEHRTAAGVLGLDRPPPPQIRDLIFQSGRPEWLSNTRLAGLYGGDGRLSPVEVALGRNKVIQGLTVRGVEEVNAALLNGLTTTATVRMPWARVIMPAAKQVPDHLQGYVRGLGGIVSDFLENNTLLRVQPNADTIAKLTELSNAYGLPLADTMTRFKRASVAAQRTTMQVGYEVSGYRDYVTAMQRAAGNMGVDYNDIRRALERKIGGFDVQTAEVRGMFPIVPGSTGATIPDAAALARARQLTANIPLMEAYQAEVARQLSIMGRDHLAGIHPMTYLEGIRHGYLRRMFQAVENPMGTVDMLALPGRYPTGHATGPRTPVDRSVIVMRKVDPAAVGDEFAVALSNPQIAATVRDFLHYRMPTRPRNAPALRPGEVPELALNFNTEDLSRLLTRKLGREVTPQQVADIVYANDDNYNFLRETMEKALSHSSAPSAAGAGGAPWGMTPERYTSREQFDLVDLAKRVLIQDPAQQIATLGQQGGRAVRSQEFIGMAYDAMMAEGLIFDHVPGALRPGHMIVPNRPNVWGPLAGKEIPADMARLFMYSLNYGPRADKTYARILTMWRKGRLAPLPTSIRNVIGAYIQIQQAGGSMADAIQNTPRAWALRRHYLDTGRLPDEFAGYEHLFGFIQDSTRSALVDDSIDRLLTQWAQGEMNATTLLDRAEAMADWTTKNPALFGFLHWFRAGEETTRTSAFLSQYDALIRNGVAKPEAVERAVHFAVNAMYNYGATPLLPDLLRRSGISAFPQFTWFTTARTARAAYENPAPLARAENARKLANTIITGGDLDEQERITAMADDWERFTRPLVLPLRDQDGRWRMLNLQYIFPQGANLMDLASEPFNVPVFAPLIDAAFALTTGEGAGPFGVRFGQRLFRPGDPPAERIGQLAGRLALEYTIPGAGRVLNQALDTYAYSQNPEAFELQSEIDSRYHNLSVTQLIGRQLGFHTRDVSTLLDDPSFRRRIGDLRRRYDMQISDLRRRLAKTEIGTNPEEQQVLIDRLEWLYEEMQRDIERLTELSR